MFKKYTGRLPYWVEEPEDAKNLEKEELLNLGGNGCSLLLHYCAEINFVSNFWTLHWQKETRKFPCYFWMQPGDNFQVHGYEKKEVNVLKTRVVKLS